MSAAPRLPRLLFVLEEAPRFVDIAEAITAFRHQSEQAVIIQTKEQRGIAMCYCFSVSATAIALARLGVEDATRQAQRVWLDLFPVPSSWMAL